jgi:O-antigen ligase
MQQNTISHLKSKAPMINVMCFISFFSVCFIPYIPIKSELSLRIEDFILPLVIFLIIPSLKQFKQMYFVLFGIWSIWAIVSMAVNGRICVVNDYFEIYKLFKFFCFVVLFWMFFQLKPDVFPWIASFFILAVIFNLFHYFNFFHFNEKVMPIFCPNPQQLFYFGRNSLGGPATKRILGTMGNPNVNAIFFSIFLIYFMSFLRKTKFHFGKILFFVSVAMLLYTQSRTGLLAFGLVFLCYLVLVKPTFIQILIYCALIFLMTIVVFKSDYYSLNYISDAKWNVQENGSLKGRIEVWSELIKMVADQPIFGYGINKTYFYEHKIYSENEYILMLWRYGIPGLFFYISLLFGLTYKYRKLILEKLTDQSIIYLLVVILLAINALTNNPISSPMILIMFAIITSMFLSQDFFYNNSENNSLRMKILSLKNG